MTGLLEKIVFETRWQVLLFSLGLCAITSLLTWLLPMILKDIDTLFDAIPLLRPLIGALLGLAPDQSFSGEMTQAYLWVHPSILTLLWAHEVMYCTRTPAGEIDRGTIDFLLGLPVSRWTVFLAETTGWILSGLLMVGASVAGHVLTARLLAPEMAASLHSVAMIVCNLFSMYVAVGAIAFLISAVSDRRNKAVGVVFAVLLASFLLTFIAQFWEPAQAWARLSVLTYYRPADVIQAGRFPLSNVLTLLIFGFSCWGLAGLVFRRRSICTV